MPKKPYKKFPPPVLPGHGKKTYDPDPKKTTPQKPKTRRGR